MGTTKVVTVRFKAKTTIRFKDPKKPDRFEFYGTDVMPNERVSFFTDIVQETKDTIVLLCSDGEWAVVKRATVADIEVTFQ